MTLKGGLPDTSASLPGWFSLESSSLPLASRISTHEAPLKRNLSVLPSATATLDGSGFFASGLASTAFASTFAGAGAIAAGSDCWGGGSGAGAAGTVAATGGGAADLRAPAPVAVGRMKSHQYIAANAITTATTTSVAAFTYA